MQFWHKRNDLFNTTHTSGFTFNHRKNVERQWGLAIPELLAMLPKSNAKNDKSYPDRQKSSNFATNHT